ncbi:hypothetical protein BWI93_02735 [Siphonobacter sp. BAB-5385]|uniref:hypothetical protein n=1 Tax=Siphonobacter sp. BAB-5385 TaxID=1864822 RepID=UPI000B9EB329|nr:hypothetical protein [Siphonobacter sp. BAB-5385]OZI09659.1 hypothetical protein BWI93_02735 [Siphonobacter sp. BAB-5385]
MDKQPDVQGFMNFLQKKLSTGFPEQISMEKELRLHGLPEGTLKAMLAAKFIVKDNSTMSRKQETPSYVFGPDILKLNALQRAERLMEILPDGKPLATHPPTEVHVNPLQPLLSKQTGSRTFFDKEDVEAIQKQVDSGEIPIGGEKASTYRIQLAETLMPEEFDFESDAWEKAGEYLRIDPKQTVIVFEQKAVLRAVITIERVY